MYPPQLRVGNAAYISSVIDLSASRIAASTQIETFRVGIQTSFAFPRLHVSYVLLFATLRIYTLHVYIYISGTESQSRIYLLNGASFPNPSCLAFQRSVGSKLTRVESKRAYKIGTMIFFHEQRLGREISAMFRITRSNLWLSLFVTRQGGEYIYSYIGRELALSLAVTPKYV